MSSTGVASAEELCRGREPTVVGTDDHDEIYGTSGDDVIAAGAGSDEIYGLSGDDVICGGPGSDQVFGDSGSDLLIGGAGGDQLNADGRLGEDNNAMVFPEYSGDDKLYGGAGDDQVRGQPGDDLISGGPGDDSLNASIGSDRVIGGDGTDRVTYFEERGPVEVRLDRGVARAWGKFPASDTLIQIEDIFGAHYPSVLVGDEGPNDIQGGGRDDRIAGGEGNDSLDGGMGADLIVGDDGDDQLSGDYGVDELIGHDGVDRADGGSDGDACDAELELWCEEDPPCSTDDRSATLGQELKSRPDLLVDVGAARGFRHHELHREAIGNVGNVSYHADHASIASQLLDGANYGVQRLGVQ